MAANVPGFGNIADELRRVTVQVLAADNSGAGSGVITGPATVITNSHVANTGELRVRLATGDLVPATLQKRDRTRDLAVLHAPGMPNTAPVAALSDTRSLRPGAIVVAVGHPMGFIGAISTGIVRAVGPVRGLGIAPWVQAAVRLAPGNSGGPLANIHGHVIGINAMVMNGLGLAVPSEAVQRLLSAAVPFRLGVTVRPARLTDGTQGMLILELDGDGPAATASLFPGDLITGIDTARTSTVEALEDALITVATERCANVIIRFRRGGGVHERQATAVAKTHPYTERAA